MNITCSQCGGKHDFDRGVSFFVCDFCGSSLIVRNDRAFQCFFMTHVRNDRWARGSLRYRLVRDGVPPKPEGFTVSYRYFPFWYVSLENGDERTMPAAATPHTELARVSCPLAELRYLSKQEFTPENFIMPAIVPDFGSSGDRAVHSVHLVFLPVYFMKFSIDGVSHRASVLGDFPRVYSDTLPRAEQKRGIHPLSVIYITAFFTLAILGWAISSSPFPVKAVLMAGATIFFIAISRFFVKA